MELFQPRFCRGKKKKCISCLKNRNYVRLFPASVVFVRFIQIHVLHVHIAPLWGPQSQSRPQEVDPTSDEKTVQCVEKESNATRKMK